MKLLWWEGRPRVENIVSDRGCLRQDRATGSDELPERLGTLHRDVGEGGISCDVLVVDIKVALRV